MLRPSDIAGLLKRETEKDRWGAGLCRTVPYVRPHGCTRFSACLLLHLSAYLPIHPCQPIGRVCFVPACTSACLSYHLLCVCLPACESACVPVRLFDLHACLSVCILLASNAYLYVCTTFPTPVCVPARLFTCLCVCMTAHFLFYCYHSVPDFQICKISWNEKFCFSKFIILWPTSKNRNRMINFLVLGWVSSSQKNYHNEGILKQMWASSQAKTYNAMMPFVEEKNHVGFSM